MRLVDHDDIAKIALGSAVLGAGGGGSPEIGRLVAQQAVRDHGPIRLIGLDELDDDALVIPVSSYGSPAVGAEKLPSRREMIACLEDKERDLGRQADVVMPIEIGGINSLYPFPAAAARGIPVLDADTMGRAFPESGMETFYLDGHLPSPMFLGDERGSSVRIVADNAHVTERLARAITVAMGGTATVCDYALSGAQTRVSAIGGTVSTAQRIGESLLVHANTDDPVGRLVDLLDGFRLITGKISEVRRTMTSGFTRGELGITGLGADAGRTMRVRFQNELLLAHEGDRLHAVTPDPIAVVDTETGFPVTTEDFRYGARITLIAFGCDRRWRTPAGLSAVGPRYFGYPVEYVPVEQLQRERS